MANEQRKLERRLEVKECILAERLAARQDQIYRNEGRLFIGKAPSKELAAERAKLFARWDKLLKYFNIPAEDTPEFLRWARYKYRELNAKGEHIHDSETFSFLRDVDEHNKLEIQHNESN